MSVPFSLEACEGCWQAGPGPRLEVASQGDQAGVCWEFPCLGALVGDIMAIIVGCLEYVSVNFLLGQEAEEGK